MSFNGKVPPELKLQAVEDYFFWALWNVGTISPIA